MKTHRCKQLLDKNDISIRWSNPYHMIKKNGVPVYHDEWWLYKVEDDYDYDVHYMKPVCSINACPFCGEELENV